MAGSNYFPESGQQGPWCWAPQGASEVIVGGGMPANHHVSFFVVWQAVERSTLPPPTGFNVFVPWVGRGDGPSNLPLPPSMEQPSQQPGGAGDEPAGLAQLRADAWRRLGMTTGGDSALARYARSVGLGMPVTQEYVVEGLTVQGFAGGIVFAPQANPAAIRHTSW
jgi:hypothetical protein